MFHFQVRRDLSSFYLAHDVEVVPGGEVRHSDLAAGAMPGRATSGSIWHRLRLSQRLGGPGLGSMLHQVVSDRTRLRDIHHTVLHPADDHHHRSLYTDRDQIKTIQTVVSYCEEEPFVSWIHLRR